MEYDKYLEEVVTTTPLALLTIKNLKSITTINEYLPYSTGFEIECMKGKNYNEDSFRKIPNIMSVINDNSEQRYRIPAGIKGLFCLYNISEQLSINSELNPESGIHYHVDMTDCKKIIDVDQLRTNTNWIIEELSSWNYQGTYNRKEISVGGRTWARFSHHNTLEIRIGEMSFDYQTLVKRIIHCNQIVRRIKDDLGLCYKPIEPEPLDKSLLEYVKNSIPSEVRKQMLYNKFISTLDKVKEDEIESKAEDLDIDNIRNIINKRNQNKP